MKKRKKEKRNNALNIQSQIAVVPNVSICSRRPKSLRATLTHL